MLRSVKKIRGYTVAAVDGKAGSIEDLLFEEGSWEIRYVVDHLGARSVLLAPAVLGNFDEDAKTLSVGLNREQVDGCIPLPAEADTRWAPEFVTPRVSAAGSAPAPIDTGEETPLRIAPGPGLRSAAELKGYTIRARDGDIGHVDDFVLDDEAWVFRYLVVDTRNWWPGKGVLVATGWIDRISWADGVVGLDLTREAIRHSPPFDPSQPVNREYERDLYEHYGEKGYW